MQKINLLDLDFEELQKFCASRGLEKYRSKQIFDWIYKKGRLSFDEMTNIPIHLRESLKKSAFTECLFFKKKLVSKDKKTAKYLYATVDHYQIEIVLIKSNNRKTLCISSQIGCPIKCFFCATGLNGFKRNLKVSEIIAQVLLFKKEISNIVFMGMGEPFLNYENVAKAIKILNSPDCGNFGARRMTVSTCGLPQEIRKFAKEGIEVNLSISLNAANDRARSLIMPINKKYNISRLLNEAKYYFQKTGRRVTFEYVLMRGINDSIKDAKELAELLKGMQCHVNLISLNFVPNLNNRFKPPTRERILLFNEILAHRGVNATIRHSAGPDINAACGQLAHVAQVAEHILGKDEVSSANLLVGLNLNVVILAAGKGTRMKSDIPKVLHTLCGMPLLGHVLKTVEELKKSVNIPSTYVIIGHQSGMVMDAFKGQGINFVIQKDQLGTGHAVMQTEPMLAKTDSTLLVLNGDTPLLTKNILYSLIKHHLKKMASATVLTAMMADPAGYGRVIRDESDNIDKIVEQKDADKNELGIKEINTGTYCFESKDLFKNLRDINMENSQSEYYLTDIIQILKNKGKIVSAFCLADPAPALGINKIEHLYEAEKILNKGK